MNSDNPLFGDGSGKRRLRLIWAAVTRPNFLSCEKFIEGLDDYLDRALPPEELQILDEHLAICHRCLHRFQFERKVLLETRQRLAHIAAPKHLKEQVLARLGELDNDP